MAEQPRHDRVRPIRFHSGDPHSDVHGDRLELLDQRLLPFDQRFVECRDAAQTAAAIRDLVVRGAPAIGIAAAYGLVLEAAKVEAPDGAAALQQLEGALAGLLAARPTAVNLAWALARMRALLRSAGSDWRQRLREEADAIAREDLAANRRMGELGAQLIGEGSGVLTHCNTGSLATAGFGTALGVIRAGWDSGRVARVYAGETRPWLQGARLTVWELQQDEIPATLIADAAASHLMKSGQVQWVVVGADRIAANGDVANKIGTYQLAIAARHHGVRFMVVAPASTVDMDTPVGSAIDIELRDGAELLGYGGARTVAEGVAAWNPVFDVTPAELIDAIVTERGIVERPDAAKMAAMFGPGG